MGPAAKLSGSWTKTLSMLLLCPSVMLIGVVLYRASASKRTKLPRKPKYGYIDRTGKFIIEPRFRSDYPFSEGLAACRQGRTVRFFTAASLVNRLEELRKQFQLERFLTQLDKADLLVCDELGYLTFSRTGENR